MEVVRSSPLLKVSSLLPVFAIASLGFVREAPGTAQPAGRLGPVVSHRWLHLRMAPRRLG